MKQEIAIKTYKFILKEINGYTDKQIKELEYYEYENDPIFEGLLNL